MASTKQYLNCILEQLSDLKEITYRAMMGEYIIYFQGKIIGGIYDNRFLVKPTKAAKSIIPDAPLESPYEGAKEMLLVEDTDSKKLLHDLLIAMANELPTPKKRNKIQGTSKNYIYTHET